MIAKFYGNPLHSLRRGAGQSDLKVAVIMCLLGFVPIGLMLWVWLSPLAFVPVPWPDDSAFYFVGREFFKWPPRWVMLPQAPFEPSYKIFNFNTMPLYPILVGAGRLLGIDGSFAIKLWPLGAWALSGSLLSIVLFRAGMPVLLSALLGMAIGMDPILRWASVLVRPESLIGLFGVALILGMSLGFPKHFKTKGLWDPIAALLALGAYAHFNSIHLLFPVVIFYFFEPQKLFAIAWRTALYLSPWLFLVVWHWKLFIHQMTTQWTRLAVPNHWLKSVDSAVNALLQNLGSPEGWPDVLYWTGVGLWLLIIAAVVYATYDFGFAVLKPQIQKSRRLAPSAGWVLGAIWLWHTKPEVWFVYYIHISVWCFVGLLLFEFRDAWTKQATASSRTVAYSVTALVVAMTGLDAYVNVTQARHLGKAQSWNWNTYRDFIDCIDERLKIEELRVKKITPDKSFSVWDPTFPDITIELSRRHPDWELTRTNDFSERAELALRHGREVDVVVVPETLQWAERNISGPLDDYPEISSVWMNWNAYFLNRLWRESGWKPQRYLCQRGRWQAFIFMNAPKSGLSTHSIPGARE